MLNRACRDTGKTGSAEMTRCHRWHRQPSWLGRRVAAELQRWVDRRTRCSLGWRLNMLCSAADRLTDRVHRRARSTTDEEGRKEGAFRWDGVWGAATPCRMERSTAMTRGRTANCTRFSGCYDPIGPGLMMTGLEEANRTDRKKVSPAGVEFQRLTELALCLSTFGRCRRLLSSRPCHCTMTASLSWYSDMGGCMDNSRLQPTRIYSFGRELVDVVCFCFSTCLMLPVLDCPKARLTDWLNGWMLVRDCGDVKHVSLRLDHIERRDST